MNEYFDLLVNTQIIGAGIIDPAPFYAAFVGLEYLGGM